ncbi:MAG: GNAT family N-acetyltransferase [Fibrella sp.]|nr:GNAT family N-acetyltransferase [Armatimonadota bacterium]
MDPDQQGLGIGAALIAQAEETARLNGAREMGLDTAEPATGLIAFYNRLGYRHIGYTQWGNVNYRSVVLSRTL